MMLPSFLALKCQSYNGSAILEKYEELLMALTSIALNSMNLLIDVVLFAGQLRLAGNLFLQNASSIPDVQK